MHKLNERTMQINSLDLHQAQ